MIATIPNNLTFPKVLTCTDGMPVEEWLKWRKQGIGGSDAAAAIGLSRYKSKIAVFYDKTADTPRAEETKKMKAGKLMEPVIAGWFQEETGKTVVRLPYLYQHPEHEYMLANLDYAIPEEEALVECKNTSYRGDWQDGMVPEEYYIQCQHYMGVTGAKKTYLVYLLDGWNLQYTEIMRNEHIISMLIEQLRNFWTWHVLTKTPPEFDGSDSSKAVINMLYPEEVKGTVLELDEEVDKLIELQDEAGKEEKAAAERKDMYANQIKAIIGDNETALTPSYRLLFKTVDSKGYTVEPKSYRRIYKSKRKLEG